jgi:hypothetical protein
MRPTPPLEILRHNFAAHVRNTRFKKFYAQILPQQITGCGASPLGYTWQEMIPQPDGTFIALPQGRFGFSDQSPLYDANGNTQIPTGTVVEAWLGYFNQSCGYQEYLCNYCCTGGISNPCCPNVVIPSTLYYYCCCSGSNCVTTGPIPYQPIYCQPVDKGWNTSPMSYICGNSMSGCGSEQAYMWFGCAEGDSGTWFLLLQCSECGAESEVLGGTLCCSPLSVCFSGTWFDIFPMTIYISERPDLEVFTCNGVCLTSAPMQFTCSDLSLAGCTLTTLKDTFTLTYQGECIWESGVFSDPCIAGQLQWKLDANAQTASLLSNDVVIYSASLSVGCGTFTACPVTDKPPCHWSGGPPVLSGTAIGKLC